MNQESRDKALDDSIRRAVGPDDRQFDESSWREKHADAIMFIESLKTDPAPVRATSRKQKWRIFMSHPLTKFAVPTAAAAVVIIILISWSGAATRLFADCLEQLQTTSYEFDIDVESANGMVLSLKGMVLEPGKLRLEQQSEKQAISTLVDTKSGQSLHLFHGPKIARFEEQDKNKTADLGIAFLPSRSIGDLWNVSAGKEKKLGSKHVNGKLAKGFQVTKDHDAYTQTISIWVEAETGHPLTVDIVLQSSTQATPPFRLSIKNFTPAPHLKPELFDLVVPRGYTLANHQKLEQVSPHSPTTTSTKSSPDTSKFLQSLNLWGDEKKQDAIDLLMTIDFSEKLRFAAEDRVFALTEKQYISLVADDKRKVDREIGAQIKQYRGLARELLKLGEKALASGKIAEAEKHFLATRDLGRLLSQNTDGFILTRLVGLAYHKAGLRKLIEVCQTSDQTEKLKAASKMLEQVEQLSKKIYASMP